MTTFKRFLTLFFIATLSAITMHVWGADVTFTKADFSGSGTISASKDGVSISCVGNIPSGGYVTFTEGNTLTISSSSGNITAIDFTCSAADYTGNMTDVSGISTTSWSITVNNPGSKTTVRVSSIVVTIGGGATYTVTLNKNGSTSEITGCSGTYTLPTTGEHVANACEGWEWHCWANAAYSTGSPTSTAPSSTVITSMTGAGTAYAVYKHSEGSGSPADVAFTKADFSGSGTISASKDGVSISCVGNIPSGGYVTFTEGNTLTISSSSGNITAIDFTCSAADYTGNMTDVSGISTTSWSITVDNPGSKTTVRVSSIVVTIGGGGTTTYTSSPDCAECLTKVTLTKGAETNGTFNLNKTGAQETCSGLTVTVTDISPADGYQFDHIEQSGVAAGNVTIDNDAKTVTYASNTTGSSSITVVFEAIPTYTVTLNKNGSTSDITGCTGTYTLPTTGEHVANACEGWEWHCWANAAYSTGSPTSTAPSSTVITTMSSAGTAYAVYKHTETSGGSSNVTFTAGTDKGSTTSTSADEMAKGGITISSTNAAFGLTDDYRLYSGSTTTISSSAGNITSIVLNSTASGTHDYGPGKLSGTGYSYSGTVGTWTGNAASVSLSASAQFRATSIVVTTDGGTTITYTSLPDCTPCENKVTLTKGEETHGTFTLNKSNGTYNNCTSDFVVTVSDISASSGYHFTGITATGGHNEVTGPDGSGNYTVTYEKGNSVISTITAVFAANVTYTVTWYMNGDESNQDSYEEGDDIIFPITADGCDGKVFRGWSAAPVAETDIEPSYVTSATMPAHDVTYYAVYAEAGSGTPSSVSYAFTDLSWNATGGNWTSGKNGAGYNNSGVQVTTGASGANATCPNSYSGITSIDVSYCTNGSSGAGSITMEVNGTSLTNTITKTGGTTARNTSFDFSSTTPTGSPRITVTCTTNSIYVCGVTIHYGGTTYTGYTTTCGAGISARNIGWITTAAGQKVKRVINVSARNFDDPTTLAASCANSHFGVTLGATDVPAGAVGLTTTLTVEYTPTESGREENVEIVLTAGAKTRTITVNGRCVPNDFLLITKKESTWYALPANMNSNAGEYDGVEVSPNHTTTPTAVAVSPSTLIYNLASVASDRYNDYGHLVRLVGNDNKCLWGSKATGATKVNIQNNAVLSELNGDYYEWDLKTTDGVHYFVESPCNAEYAEGRRLGYGSKFGMYKEETVFFIVQAGCSSQPGEINIIPRRVDATFSWVSNCTNMHIDLYTNAGMTEGHKPATATSSPYVFTGLAETTDYWYKLTPDDDTECAVTGTFKTTGPLIDIVEWQENGVVLFIDKGDVNPVVVIDGQEEHGSITGGGTATELFFAKYFEGAGSMKLLSIFNGTKEDISLANYKFVDRHAGDAATSYGDDSEYALSTLGSIKAGQEIIFFSRPLGTETELSACSTDFLNAVATKNTVEDNPRWIECASGKFANKAITINGNDAVLLKKNETIIDVIGALNTPGQETNCKSEDAWKGTIKNMDKGKSPSDPAFDAFYEASSKSPSSTADSIAILAGFGINLSADEIEIPTARCIFFRDKRVISGDSAVAMNEDDFVTFTNHTEGGQDYKAEWYGRSVCMTNAMKTAAGVTSDAQATCNSYQDIANMDYNKYYIDWTNINPGTELSEYTSDPATKEYTIPIKYMRQYACLKLRFQLKRGEEVLTEAAQQVPIVVAKDAFTNDTLFSELVKDKTTGDPSYSHSVERCKTCDVVVLNNKTLTKGPDSDEKDVPEIGNLKIYPNGKLIVPSTTEYTVKSLAFRRQEDDVASANIQGSLNIGTANGTYLDFRIDPTNWHYFSLPYDCNVSDIRFANEEEVAVPVLGTDFLLKKYNGEKRAATQAGGCWEMVGADETLKKGIGYIFALPGDGKVRREFRFPMENEVIDEEKGNKMASPVYGYGCDKDYTQVRANHRGWNLLGNPYLLPYTSDIESPIMTGYIVEDHSTDPWDGHYKFADDARSNLRYIVEPQDNGWSEYIQVAITDYSMKPFTSYFVQVGGDDPEEEQGVQFNLGKVDRSSIVRRKRAEYEEVEDTHPVWCAVNLINSKDEKDETTLLISNDFTDEYDMMNDLVKMRGDYYQYAQVTTKPVLASRNNEGEMAFNALPDASAEAGVPLNFFSAYSGSYTIAYNDKFDCDNEVKEVKLFDKTTNKWYDLMNEPYEFSTGRENNTTRFILSVRVERKKTPQIATDIDHIGSSDGPRKLLIDGNIYIQRGNRIYDVTGKQAVLQ